MSFSVDLQKFATKTHDQISLVIRKIVLDLFTRIVLKTPVKTGRARMNWHVSIGQIRDELRSMEREYSGAEAFQTANAEATNKILALNDVDLSIFILNNLPYIERLEDGYSDQAPSGMVKITLEEYPYIVQDAVEGNQ